MKQVIQSLNDGSTTLVEVPVPLARPGHLLIRSDLSLVSAGTERMLVKFGKSGWISKARQQPDKVKMVMERVKTDGIAATYEAVKSKLDQPLALGYCNVGYVAEVGAQVDGFKPGDRVVSNGSHSEFVAIPKNLCAHVPENVTSAAASFTVLGAIGLQGIRLAQPTLGECVVVTGLGLIGLLTVQLLRAQGCRVLGIDFDDTRLAIAQQFGAETVNPGKGQNVLTAATAFSRGNGVDAVIITASSESDELMRQAAQMCRKRGRIVLIGVVGLQLNRADFYEKELTFQVSCSYGPGRYDPAYEEQGHDYPIGFVRWTEKRNFEAVLDLMSAGVLDLDPLITHQFDIDKAQQAMNLLTSDEPSMGILINYPQPVEHAVLERLRTVTLSAETPAASKANVAFLGAGNYASRVLIPAFKDAGASLSTVVSSGGVSAVHFGKKYGFSKASTDSEEIMEDASIDTVVIGTRHDLHARQVLTALKAGKHIYCEKPLCLTLTELEEIEEEARARPSQHLMVGFNRRFAPLVVKTKALIDTVSVPKNFIMTVNAGDIPPDHWTQDPDVGGGRIIGEGCHFIDLLRHLAGAEIVRSQISTLGAHDALPVQSDKAVITLEFADGSIGVINYLANGHKAVSKERLEIFAAGRVLRMDNFLRLKGYGWPGMKNLNSWKKDNGQKACPAAFVNAIKTGGATPIPLDEVIESSRVSIELGRSTL